MLLCFFEGFPGVILTKLLYLLVFISTPIFAGWEESYDQVREARGQYFEKMKAGPITPQSKKEASRGLSESNRALANDLVAINRKSESQFFSPPKPGEPEPTITNTNPTLADLGVNDDDKGEAKTTTPAPEKEEKKSVISRASASVKEFVDSVLAPEKEEAAPIDGSNMPKFIEFKSKKK